MWHSYNFGSDSLTLNNLPAGGDYYIGVYGYSASQFRISAYYQDVLLRDGQSSFGKVSGLSSQYVLPDPLIAFEHNEESDHCIHACAPCIFAHTLLRSCLASEANIRESVQL